MKYVEYLPEFFHEIEDFPGFGMGTDPETEEIRKRMKDAALECFAQTAGEEGIGRFEKMFGILPVSDEPLEQRRFRILGRFRNLPPFSMGWLREKLMSDCGEGNFSVSQDVSQSLLRVSISSALQDMAEVLYGGLRENIPAAVVLKMGILHQPHTQTGVGVILQVGGKLRWEENDVGTV